MTDPVIAAIERIETGHDPICHETRLLLEMAKQAQRTGRLPDVSALVPKVTTQSESVDSTPRG